jgi:hypothetical protein
VKLFSLFAVRIASTSLIGSTIALSILASSALAETFQVSGNKSLNTNNQFSYIDGHPRMAVYDSNNSDPDQNFDRLAGKWGVLFRNRSTNMCINAYYNYDGGAVSNWPCDANDPAQNFNLVGQGGNIVLLRKSNTNFCLNVPYHVNEGKVTAWTCNTSDVDQRFLMGNVTGSGGSGVLYPPITVPPIVPATKPTPAVVPKPTPSPVISYLYEPATPLYEYWIVSRKTDTFWGIWSPLNGTEVGHSFTAIIRKNRKVTKTFSNGNLISVSAPQDDGTWYPHHTYGFWNTDPNLKIDNGSTNDKAGTEWRNVKDILSGVSISQAGWGIRKMRISVSRANYIHSNFNGSGCIKYLGIAASSVGGRGYCNCVDYATRQWYLFAAQRSNENFTPGTDAKSPSGLVNDINNRNYFSGSDFVDKGATWD